MRIIDADALREEISREFIGGEEQYSDIVRTYNEGLEKTCEIIDKAPTVEARKNWKEFENKADWIYLGETPCKPPLYRFKCGKCGYVMPLTSKGDIINSHFCEFCGYPMNTYISEEEKSYREWLNE